MDAGFNTFDPHPRFCATGAKAALVPASVACGKVSRMEIEEGVEG